MVGGVGGCCCRCRGYSLKRMAPVLSTKKKVPTIDRIIVVNDATITIWVTVTWRHQGTVSCSNGEVGEAGVSGAGGVGGRQGVHAAALANWLVGVPRAVATYGAGLNATG